MQENISSQRNNIAPSTQSNSMSSFIENLMKTTFFEFMPIF